MEDKIKLCQPTYADILELAKNIRESDIKELQAVTSASIIDAIQQSIDKSHPDFLFSISSKKKLIGIGGCTMTGNPWLLMTNEVTKYPKASVKIARGKVNEMLITFGKLTNVIDCDSHDNIRWLRLIGFKFSECFTTEFNKRVIIFEASR